MASKQNHPADTTGLLRAWRGGDQTALEPLSRLIYQELRRRAKVYLRGERAMHSLQGTELAHEAFLRLLHADVSWQSRAHFLAVAAGSMRRILVDHARTKRREKRGGGRPISDLDDVQVSAPVKAAPKEDLIALDGALRRLAVRDPRKSQVVELSFFGGLTVREIAEALGTSKSAVQRDLGFSKAWLHRQLT